MSEANLTSEIRAKRVAIAKDVKEQIVARAYRYQMKNGYIVPDYFEEDHPLLNLKGDMQEHVEKFAQNCTVCNLGGLLLSKARLFDNVDVSPFALTKMWGDIDHNYNRHDLVESLTDVFDHDTLDNLESAFEASSYFAVEYHQGKVLYFGAKAGSPTARVWACMNNIIANNGIFDYKQEPDLTGFPGEY